MGAVNKNPAFTAWVKAAALPWRTASCRRFNAIRNGGTPSSQTPEFWGGEIMWLTPDDLGKIEGKSVSESQRMITDEGVAGSNAAIVPTGSILLSTRAPIGHVAIAARETAFNQGCRAIVPSPAKYQSDYLYYYTLASRPVLQASGNGTTFKELSWEELASLPLPLIPLKEQEAISNFLDCETARLDALIDKKRRLLELLEEKRLAVITHAVTKGLDRNAPMKDSGFSWIGRIPRHWQVKRLKFTAPDSLPGIQIGPFGGMITNLPDEETGYKLYGQENTISGDFSRGHRWIEEDRFNLLYEYSLEPGDIVVTRKGSLGGCRIVPSGIVPGIMDSDTIRIRPDRLKIHPDFLAIILREANYISCQIEQNKRGAILAGLNTQTVSNLYIVIPPTDEQDAILQYLQSENARIVRMMAANRHFIGVMEEYRSALITNAVTGKIDVRAEVV
jgi:type I restriction enzyme S subunit